MRFDAAAFDLDGTLYPALSLYALALPMMLRKARPFLAFSAARGRMRELGCEDGPEGPPPRDGAEFRARQAALVAASLGIGRAEAAALIDRDFYRGVEDFFDRVKSFRGLEAALGELARGGLRLALLSDLPPARKLELLGLTDRFEAALCSEDSGALKPAGRPFAMLAARLGLAPERILYIGNSARIDLRGAKAAGMSAAIVSRRRVKGADLSFFDWRDLVRFALR
jgi:putative hydrolase of the HAD superfamily